MLNRALRAERRLRALADAVAEVVWTANAAGEITEPSPSLERFTGRPTAELAGLRWVDTIHPDDREALTREMAEAIRGGAYFAVQYRMRRADGEWRLMEARGTPVRDEDGAVLEWMGVNVDVTDRRATETQLRASDALHALVFNSGFDSMYLVSVDGPDEFRVRLVNEAFTRITGVPAREVVGRELRDIARNQAAAIQVARYRDVAATRRAVEYEEHYVLNDREQVMETRLSPVVSPSGTVTHVLGVSRDVSERRRLERERQEMEMKLQHTQKLESLGVLAGGVAHDFNNLLVGILGNASLALLDLEAGSELAETVGDIERTARQAAELTTQLLAYSGKGRFVVAPTDLAALVREMSPVWRSALGRRATVTLELADDLPPVEGDASQLRQVVLNMITNAVDALGGEAGHVTVRAGLERLDAAALARARFATGAEPGEHVFVEVEDDGCGMDAHTIERIFDPFFTTKFTGRGLGLAATLGIVRGHRGVITVRSAPGAGTSFRVAFPARRDLVAAGAVEAEGALPDAAGTVLVIDDDAPVRSAARRILGRAGFAVLEAVDGESGIATFRAAPHAIACVMVDLTMPGMDGMEVAAGIRAIRPAVRIVLASGFDAGAASGFPAGDYVFLHKPFTASQLVEAVGIGHGS